MKSSDFSPVEKSLDFSMVMKALDFSLAYKDSDMNQRFTGVRIAYTLVLVTFFF